VERLNPQALWKCVRETTKVYSEKILSSGAEVEMVVTTYATENILDYAAYSMATVAAWAQEHEYPMRIYDEQDGMFDSYDPRWNKVMVVKDALTKWAPQTKTAMWFDADLTVLDFDFTVHDILQQSPDSLMFMCAEPGSSSTYANSGSFLSVNTPRAIELLDLWWTIDDRKLRSDQNGFEKMLSSGVFKGDELRVLPPNFFNTDPPAMEKHLESDRVLHLMGEMTPYRTKVFGRAFDEVCQATQQGRAQKHQLGITRRFLLTSALDTYKQLHKEALKTFERNDITNFEQRHFLYLGRVSERLQISLRYAGYMPEALKIMNADYERMVRALSMLQVENIKVPMESLRMQVYHGIMVMEFLEDMNSIQALYGRLDGHLRLLEDSAEPAQLPDVWRLRSRLDESMTIHLVYAQEWDKAIESQRRAIQVLEHPEVEDHTRTSPLGMLASLLCQKGSLSEAFPMFERVIKLESARLGRNNKVVALRYLNMGKCKYDFGMFKEALSDFERANRIHVANDLPTDDVQVRNTNHYLQLATKAAESLELW
jgi:tetratricopeptide (TPR) repeat protein